jgi:peptide/nickel transport system permease protein
MLIGIPAGILAAVRRESAVDKAVMAGAVLGYSIPNFLLGLIFVSLFAVWLRVLPSSGSSTWWHMVLPVATFALYNAAAIAFSADRRARTALHCCRARGRHTQLGDHSPTRFAKCRNPDGDDTRFTASGLLGGAVLIEPVFAWPGLCSGFVTATSSGPIGRSGNDYPVHGLHGDDQPGCRHSLCGTKPENQEALRWRQ